MKRWSDSPSERLPSLRIGNGQAPLNPPGEQAMLRTAMGSYEVVIAGGGPAGVACAVALVRAEPSLRGRGRVLVLERARFPRAKPCGGGLTGHVEEAMAALGLTLTVPSFPAPRARVRYGTVEREVMLGRAVRVVRREEFDASLVAQARELGVTVRESTPLLDFSVENGGVSLQIQGGALRARVLVGADGAGSLVRKRILGQGGQGGHNGHGGHGDRVNWRGRPPIRLFRAEIPATGRTGDAMFYDFTPMRDGLRGYLWVFPVPGGRLNVGLMHYPCATAPLSGGELARLLRLRLADHGIALPDGAELRGWPAWGYRPDQQVAAPHLLLVGDAAGIDALTGEGIAVGLEHGPVAARAILAALSSGDFSMRGYRRAIRRATVGRELALDRLMAALLYDGENYLRWLSLVLCDVKLVEFYAARVSGTVILADQKPALLRAFLGHVLRGRQRQRVLRDAI